MPDEVSKDCFGRITGLHIQSQFGSYSDISPICRWISLWTPLLTNLTFSVGQCENDGIVALVEMFRHTRTLRKVHLAVFHQIQDISPLVSVLARLPFLEEVKAVGNGNVPFWWYPDEERPFPSLKVMEIIWDGIPGIPSLLNAMGSDAPLRSITAINGSPSDEQPCVRDVLTAAGGHKNIETIVVSDNAMDYTTLLPRHFVPIYQCSALTILIVDTGGKVGMTDEDIGFLVSHLARLEFLKLGGESNWEDDAGPPATLDAFRIIVAACSNIADIHLEVNTTDCTPKGLFKLQHALRHVHVGYSRLTDTQAGAIFFAQLSNADEFGVESELDADYGWEEVMPMVSVLRKSRKENGS